MRNIRRRITKPFFYVQSNPDAQGLAFRGLSVKSPVNYAAS
jgi:hypothetical protein